MFSFDPTKFFTNYRNHFRPLHQDLFDAINLLLNEIQQDSRFSGTITDRHQLAYCLATFNWETAHTMKPIDEHGSDDYFNSNYGPQTHVGKMLGNTEPGDGALFHGRGYVQLTGRANYAKAAKLTGVDLLSSPDRAKEPHLAYEIAIQGMKDGWFTGKKLSNFFVDGQAPDYEKARTIINGHDRASIIAGIARQFDDILSFSNK
ncbi:MAG: hypothetical protein WAQ98_04450 [Blastocatellia bacterium]